MKKKLKTADFAVGDRVVVKADAALYTSRGWEPLVWIVDEVEKKTLSIRVNTGAIIGHKRVWPKEVTRVAEVGQALKG